MDTARYYSVTLVVSLTILGIWADGIWVWLGIATLPVLLLLDIALPPDHGSRRVSSRLLVNVPVYLHVPLMLVLWAVFLDRLHGWSSGVADPHVGQTIGAILSVGWIGALPNVPVTHELWHRRHWVPRTLAKIGSTFYLDPNRDVGHNLTHHIALCTPEDSDTPARGQNIYKFMWQASYGSWRDGVATSLLALRKRDRSVFHYKNAVYIEMALLGALTAAVYVAAGIRGCFICAATTIFSKLLAEGFNYLQHYGMVRVPGAPIRRHHAWNHLGRIMRPVGLEITNHMDHHFDSRHQFFELTPRVDGAQMPSAFLCFVCALVPPLWEKTIAQPRLRHWDTHFASPAERIMAMEQNLRAGWPIWIDVQHSEVRSFPVRSSPGRV